MSDPVFSFFQAKLLLLTLVLLQLTMKCAAYNAMGNSSSVIQGYIYIRFALIQILLWFATWKILFRLSNHPKFGLSCLIVLTEFPKKTKSFDANSCIMSKLGLQTRAIGTSTIDNI